MLGRYYSLLSEILKLKNLKKCPLTELENEDWLRDLRFMLDITKHVNNLNEQLQGSDQLLHPMSSKIKSFISMLSLWENQLKDNDCTHFPTLKNTIRLLVLRMLRNVPLSWKALNLLC